MFEPNRVYSSTGDLEVDLHIYIDRPCVLEFTLGAKQVRDETSKDNELRPISVVVDDTHKRGFGRFPCCPGAEQLLIDHAACPEDAQRLPRLARRRREGRHTRGATEQDGARVQPWPDARL